MKTKLRLSMIVFLGVLVVAFLTPIAYADTVTINFDSFAIPPITPLTGTPVTDYLAGYGVTLSGMLPGEVAFIINLPGPPYEVPSPPNVFSANGGFNGVNTLTLNFSTPVDNFSFDRIGTYAYPGSPSGTVMGPWSATAYNTSNVSLGTVGNGWIATYDEVPIESFTFAAQGISHIDFLGNSFNYAGFALPCIDNLTFTTTSVPEPSTLFLLGSGLMGLGGIAWRRHRK